MTEVPDCRYCHKNSGFVRDLAADVYGGPRVVTCLCLRGLECASTCPCVRSRKRPAERGTPRGESGWGSGAEPPRP